MITVIDPSAVKVMFSAGCRYVSLLAKKGPNWSYKDIIRVTDNNTYIDAKGKEYEAVGYRKENNSVKR